MTTNTQAGDKELLDRIILFGNFPSLPKAKKLLKLIKSKQLEELKPISFRVKDALSVSSGPRVIVRTHLVDEFIDKRMLELKPTKEISNGK